MWVPDDIDKGKLEYYYVLLAGVSMVNFFYFLIVARLYKYSGSVDNQIYTKQQIDPAANYGSVTTSDDFTESRHLDVNGRSPSREFKYDDL